MHQVCIASSTGQRLWSHIYPAFIVSSAHGHWLGKLPGTMEEYTMSSKANSVKAELISSFAAQTPYVADPRVPKTEALKGFAAA